MNILMSYASRFFQSLGATTVHAGPARLTSIADAVDGRKALRHAFESARHGERKAHFARPVGRLTFPKILSEPERVYVSVGHSYMPKRRNQHSKAYTVVGFMAGTNDVMFHRGNPEKVDSMAVAKFIETVKL